MNEITNINQKEINKILGIAKRIQETNKLYKNYLFNLIREKGMEEADLKGLLERMTRFNVSDVARLYKKDPVERIKGISAYYFVYDGLFLILYKHHNGEYNDEESLKKDLEGVSKYLNPQYRPKKIRPQTFNKERVEFAERYLGGFLTKWIEPFIRSQKKCDDIFFRIRWELEYCRVIYFLSDCNVFKLFV
ncbi:hypothetical protein [Archaeoglobus sp.]